MVALGPAHVGARLGRRDGDPLAGERGDQRVDRRHAAEVDHGSGPVEHHRFDRAGQHAAFFAPLSNGLMTASARPKPIDAPQPVVTITRRTSSAGASMSQVRSEATA